MTHVDFIYDEGMLIGFEMLGHAGFNQGGPDIICSALSATSQMTVNGILDFLGCSNKDIIKVDDKQKGHLKVVVPKPYNKKQVPQHMLRSFEMYITGLHSLYDDYVKVERRDYDDNKDN